MDGFCRTLGETQSFIFGPFVFGVVAGVSVMPNRLDLAINRDSESEMHRYLNRENYFPTEQAFQYERGLKATEHRRQSDGR